MRLARLLPALLLPAACAHPPAPETTVEAAPKARLATSTPATKVAPLAGRWWRDDVFYEIFVRSFCDSDGDGVGDFKGLTSKLDVLNDGDPSTDTDLGITGIWLMPMHPSPSYHGYDVTDYRGVNPDYGTMEDFDHFLAEAHRRGIKVIIDFVLNHSAKDHPWFADARSGKDAEHRGWYTFRDAPDARWKRPWDGGNVWHETGVGDYYYGLFWSGMPDVNLDDPAAAEAMISAMEFWLERGVDGFRVDAVRHLFESEDGVLVDQPKTHAFMRKVQSRLTKRFPEALLVAEAWTDTDTVAKYYGDADEFGLAFSFDAGSALLTAAKDGLKVSMSQYTKAANAAYPDRGFEAPFVTNHDMPRAMRQLKGDVGAAKVAAATLFALPGTPFLYYGEEIGMQGGPTSKDEDKRTPMRWSAAPGYGFTAAKAPWHAAEEADDVELAGQRATEGSLWRTYRDLVRVRRGAPALTDGAATELGVAGGGRGGFALLRAKDGARVLFVANYHREATGPVSIAVEGRPEVLLSAGVGEVRGAGGRLEISALGPQSYAFIRLTAAPPTE